ncbi:hypothetical protein D3C85_1911290 [compost metagenome]
MLHTQVFRGFPLKFLYILPHNERTFVQYVLNRTQQLGLQLHDLVTEIQDRDAL